MISIKLVESLLIFSVALVHIHGDRFEADAEDAIGGGEARVMYDQRQSGKYNIHVVIKDVAIIEMDQNEIEDVDYSNEDYYYDENHLTVKPITLNPTIPTTKKPSTNIGGIEPTNNKESTTTYKSTSSQEPLTKIPTTAENTVDSAATLLLNQKDETTEEIANLKNTLSPNTSSWFGSKHPINDAKSYLKPMKSSQVQHNFFNGPIELKTPSKVEPLYAMDETQLQPKSRDVLGPLEKEIKSLTNSKIYKVKVHRSHQSPHNYSPLRVQTRRCRSNQYRDISGNCRTKRSQHSGSLLKRLFSMLVTLPFVRGGGEQLDDN